MHSFLIEVRGDNSLHFINECFCCWSRNKYSVINFERSSIEFFFANNVSNRLMIFSALDERFKFFLLGRGEWSFAMGEEPDPVFFQDMSEEELAALVTRDSMIGVTRARTPITL